MSVQARHARSDRTRRVRRRVLVAGTALALVGGGTAVAGGVRSTDGCDGSRHVLDVVAAPDIAPTVAAVARSTETLRDSGGCSEVDVRAEAEADVLSALAGGTAKPPDVWIPASSLWVGRAGDLVSPVRLDSVASSPLVLAVPSKVRDSLTGPDGSLQWDAVIGAALSGAVVLDAPAPETSPATVSLVVALQAEVDHGPTGRAALTARLRALNIEPASGADAADPRDAIVPDSEQAVWAQNPGTSAEPVAVYPPVPGTPFDYPFVELTSGADSGALAEQLLTALLDTRGQDRIRAAGFRGMDGIGSGLTPDHGVDGSQPTTVAVPDVATADEAARTLDAVHRDARLLAVVDISGSMAAPVPGAGGSTRLDLAVRAVVAGLSLYPDSTEVGFWGFSRDLTATSDHQELLPITPLSGGRPDGRERLTRVVGQVSAIPDGGTGLYDTTLAAVRAVRAGWDPERVNAVVLLTDGENTDDSGIGLDQLLSTLGAEQADGRPVPVITIAYGPDSGADVLAAISRATGGASYRTTDPDGIRQVFLDAVGQRACRPQCPPQPSN